MKNDSIIIISLLFAPDSRVGAKRFTFLNEYLKKYFKNIHIVTIHENQIPNIDDTFVNKGSVHRVRMFPAFPNIISKNRFVDVLYKLWRKYFCLIDPYSGWIIPAFIKVLRISKKYKVNKVIITGPPFSPMVVGILLSLFKKYKIIIDYRDPWSNHFWENQNLLKKSSNKLLEKILVKRASSFVFCSEVMEKNFLEKFKIGKNKKHIVITNGFDGNKEIRSLTKKNAKFKMVYAGNFYGKRKLKIITLPLSYLLREGTINNRNFEFHIYGSLDKNDKKEVENLNLKDLIIEHDKIPYDEILKVLKGSDALFLPSASNVQYAIPFKFFDYLMVKKPIFTIAPKGSAIEKFSKKLDCGIFCDIHNMIEIKNNLKILLNNPMRFSFMNIERYHWKNIANDYADFLNTI